MSDSEHNEKASSGNNSSKGAKAPTPREAREKSPAETPSNGASKPVSASVSVADASPTPITVAHGGKQVQTFSKQSSLFSTSRPHSPKNNPEQTGQPLSQGLAVFDSIPTTPVPHKAEVPKSTTTPTKQSEESNEAPLKDRKYPNYAASMDETEDADNIYNQEEDRHPELGYNSFALDLSFVSNTSLSQNRGEYASLGRAVFHVFKGNVGAGVFLLPTFYNDAGFILGPIVVAILGAIMIDCVSVLLRTKLAIDHVEIKTYPAVVGFVLGDFFLQITKFSLIFTQFGFCVMYYQYASSIFSSLFAGGAYYGLFVGLSILVVTPMTFLSNRMDILAYASMVAGIFVGLVLCGTTAVDIQNLASYGFGPDVSMCVPTAKIIVFLSGHMFSLEGIGIVLPVENSVAPSDRPRFRVVVKYTLTCIVALYIAFGVLGYMAYGAVLTNSVVQALPPSMIKNIMQCLLGLSLLFGYPIQFIPAIQLVDKSLNVQDGSKRANLMRVVLNIAFGVAAASIGQETINLFASFLGAFVGVHLMITLPALLGLLGPAALDGERDNYSSFGFLLLVVRPPYDLKKIKYYAYLLLALVVWVGGMYYTIRSVLTGS